MSKLFWLCIHIFQEDLWNLCYVLFLYCLKVQFGELTKDYSVDDVISFNGNCCNPNDTPLLHFQTPLLFVFHSPVNGIVTILKFNVLRCY